MKVFELMTILSKIPSGALVRCVSEGAFGDADRVDLDDADGGNGWINIYFVNEQPGDNNEND